MEFDELYQEVILDHARRPRNYGELPDANVHVHGDNPMCGDEITLHLKLTGDEIEAAAFTGAGCSICMASASLMTIKLKGRSRPAATDLMRRFHEMLTGPGEPAPDPQLGDLQSLTGVRKFPLRVKCATLPWHALAQALTPGEPNKEVHVKPDWPGGERPSP